MHYDPVCSLSGLVVKGIDVAAGVIKRDCTGKFNVISDNNLKRNFSYHTRFTYSLACLRIKHYFHSYSW